jgi:hypothetical protein
MRALDFLLRLAFFATVPFLATFVAAFFPMTGVVVNIAVTLVVFAFAEALRERSERSRILKRVMARRFAFEAYYKENPPRPFLFYVLYPLLLPYVLARPVTRRELLLYRGFTGGGLAILVGGAVFDFYWHWLPELAFGEFIKVWVALFIIQTLAMFVFLLPVSTTVVKLHSERRLAELWVLLGAAAISVGLAVGVLVHKRGHIVSWVTSHRVMLRTKAAPDAAHAAQLKALHGVLENYAELVASTDAAGWSEGDSAERAEEHLGTFYKSDESYAFSLHALPPAAPEVILLQCWIIGGGPPIWRAIKKTGEEITDKKDLPPGILGLKPCKNKKAGTLKKGALTGASAPKPGPSAPKAAPVAVSAAPRPTAAPAKKK